jgi:hypothetical protein
VAPSGKPLFFYGTLLDEDVRAVVLRRHAPAGLVGGVLRGWRRVSVVGASFPILVRSRGGFVTGVLAYGLSARALAILDAWEQGYRRARVVVECDDGAAVSAETYVPQPGRFAIGATDWDLACWQRRHKPAYIALNRAWRSRR